MTLIFGFIAGYIFAYIYEKIMLLAGKRIRKKSLVILGYRLHHSIYGLVAILLSLLIRPNIFLISLGLGIIAQHYFTGDGLVFITKNKH